jgi:hypothetical protein
MPNYDAIINITNSFNAATKLREMNLGDMRSGSAIKAMYQSPELLGKALKTVAQHAPENFRGDNRIYEQIDRWTLILNTYQELNNKVTKARGDGFKTNDIISIAKVIKPIMNNRNQNDIEKFLRIYEILNS